MSETINATNTGALPTSLTVAEDDDDILAADVKNPVQALLNSVNKVGALVIADFAALAANTTAIDGERFYVQGKGLFEFRAASGVGAVTNRIIARTAGGRFFVVDDGVRGAANGLATLDGGGRPAETAHGATIFSDAFAITSPLNGTNGTYADVTGSVIDCGTLAIGDVVMVNAVFDVTATGGSSDTAFYRMVVREGSTDYQVGPELETSNAGSAIHLLTIFGRRAVAAAGNVKVAMQSKKSAATAWVVNAFTHGRAQVVRP